MKKVLTSLSLLFILILTGCGTYQGDYDYFSISADEYGIETGYAIAFPKGSKLTPQFDEILTLMKEDQTLACIDSYWTEGQTDECYGALDFTNKVYSSTINGNGRTLNILTSSGYEPFEMADASGKLTGFDIDLANFIAKELNYKLNWQDAQFERIVGDLANNKADVAIAAMTPDEERRKSVDFSIDYFEDSYTVVLYKGDDNFDSIDDLKGKVVSAQSGTIQAKLIQKLKDENKVKNFILYNYPATAMQAMKTNKVDVFFVEESIAKELIETYNK